MLDECRHYYEDEDRFKCCAGHACYCRFGQNCPDFETLEEWRSRKNKEEEK